MFQKKKEVLPEPEPLTEKDIQQIKEKLTKKDIHKNEEVEVKVKDLKMIDLLPQDFGEVAISILDKQHTITFSDTMNGDKYRTFRKSKGGMFSRDALAYTRGKDNSKYLLIEGNGERKVVRIIEDGELLLFQTLKLIHGIIKDRPYMLLKELGKGEKIPGGHGYIKKNSETEEEIEDVMNVNPTKIDIEDDHNSVGSSVSLFDE
jgi:hypothetical protein